jgi:hypothetical protein
MGYTYIYIYINKQDQNLILRIQSEYISPTFQIWEGKKKSNFSLSLENVDSTCQNSPHTPNTV